MKYSDISGAEFDEVIGGPKTSVGRKGSYAQLGKRVFDIGFSIVLLPLIAPVLLVLAALVRRDGGPAFFGHERIGLDGRRFRCWKVRSMVPDAEETLKRHLQDCPAAAAEWEESFKLKCDPRITRLGDLMRKTSLDELPQIWNVLRGDMSFVGPRPIVREELARYGSEKNAYLSVRPGITGPWQVQGRNDISYADRVGLDTAYVSNLSFMGDLRLIAMTITVVLAATGR